ncbi:MAG: crotonase/enoyl-CoA hydratase family protein [Gammaproteobacteria bacterium AqS3]|nr:crotonase/enoyl-CoA hydratase family protein [Gammaproteobacteria bacterium AqS3]
MSYESIIFEKRGHSALVTLNRPDRMNAFTGRMAHELIAAIDECDADDDIRAVIFTGAGERAFCAGADLERGADTFKYAAVDAGEQKVRRDSGGLVTLRMYESKKPLIAAFNGAAVGIGVTMTLPMDIRIASEGARFGFVFSRRGIVPEAASSWFLPRLVGISQALEWTYSGRVFGVDEALCGGLVTAVHPADELLRAAEVIADEIAENTSSLSVTMIRQMMWKMLGADHPMAAHQVDSRGIAQLGEGPDAAEGVKSFLEKRPPQFAGRISSDLPDVYPWWEEPEFK